MAGLMCDYGGCTGGVVLQCSTDGYWAQVMVHCP
jgi:hypothetical protein